MASSDHPPAVGSGETVAPEPSEHHEGFGGLVLGCIGIVYGDIGTSPIYAFREALRASGGPSDVTHQSVLGRAVAHPLGADAGGFRQVCGRRPARRQPWGRRDAVPDGTGTQAHREAPQHPRALARRDRCRPVLRRCHDHSGHLGPVRGGGPRGHPAESRGVRPADHGDHPDHPVYGTALRDRRRRRHFRPRHRRLVPRARRIRGGPYRRRTGSAAGHQSLSCGPVPVPPYRCRPGGDRRQSFWPSPGPRRSTPISAISGASRSCSPGTRSSSPVWFSTISARAPSCSPMRQPWRIPSSRCSRRGRWCPSSSSPPWRR